MLKKHLTVLFLLIMVVGAFAQSIPSGTARYEALGFNPFIMDAATDMNRNPAWSGMYRNYSFGDIGRYTPGNQGKGGEYQLNDQYGGVNFGLGKTWNAGVVLNKPEGQIFRDSWFNFFMAINNVNQPIVPFELMIGYTASNKKMTLGFAPYVAMWSKDSTSSGGTGGNFDRSSSILGGTIGIVNKMSSGWWEANVDARLNKFKSTSGDTVGTTTTESNGGFEINFNARAFLMMNKPNKVNLVPYVGFSMFNWNPTFTPSSSTTWDFKNMSITAGVGINMPILDHGLLAGGLSFGYAKQEGKTSDTSGTAGSFTNTSITLPRFNVGAEWNFNDWLTGRAGYSRGIIRTKNELSSTVASTTTSSTVNETVPTNPQETITLGLGWHFDRFSLDGLIGERFFQEGAYIFGGKDNDMYGILSASYNFNK